MNKKNLKDIVFTISIIILSVFCLNILGPTFVKADSGFDGGYGGGSSGGFSGSGGGSSHSWGGTSLVHHSGNTSGEHVTIAGVIIFFILVIIVVIVTTKKKKSFNNYDVLKTLYNTPKYDINKIKEVISTFDIEEFRMKTYKIYKDIQVAWMDFDYNALRNLVTDEMFNMYSSQLETLSVKGQKNIMKDFALLDFSINNMIVDEENIAIDINMNISCKDYIVDANNGILRGSKFKTVVYKYSMTFIKGKHDNFGYCPNCKAKINNVASNKCEACGSIIVSDKHDWVLSKKKVNSQYTK